DVPAGLALAVQKMMAKRPADRFQSAEEAAEALLPFVSSSSAALPDVRKSVSWQRGQLRLSAAPPAGRLVRRYLIGLAVAALMAVSALAGAWLLKGDAPEGTAPGQVSGGETKRPPKPKVETIPNGLTVAKDGTGQLDTIQAAL